MLAGIFVVSRFLCYWCRVELLRSWKMEIPPGARVFRRERLFFLVCGTVLLFGGNLLFILLPRSAGRGGIGR